MDRMGGRIITLAKKFEAVHSTTTTKSSEIPRDRLAVPPNRVPFAALMGLIVCCSRGDSLDSNGCCCDGEIGGMSVILLRAEWCFDLQLRWFAEGGPADKSMRIGSHENGQYVNQAQDSIQLIFSIIGKY